MIELYSWPTPNGEKVHILLEECGLPYVAHPIDIGKDEQFAPEFLRISPNNKIPAIVDTQGSDGQAVPVFESCAILMYLATKTGQFIPAGERERWEVLQWLMFQVGSVGPMLGQAHHFRRFAPEHVPYAIDRYTRETARIYGVLERRLAERTYLVGAEYTIADIAVFPWIKRWELQGIAWSDFPRLRVWFDRLSERPAVQRGGRVLAHLRK